MTDLDRLKLFFSEILEDIKNLKEQVDSLTASDQAQETRLDTLDTLTTWGTWCAYQDSWKSVGTIKYDRLTFSDTNWPSPAIFGTPMSYSRGSFQSQELLIIGYSDIHVSI